MNKTWREQFEEIKYGCPLTEIETMQCRAQAMSIDERCHYKNCPIMYFISNLKLIEEN